MSSTPATTAVPYSRRTRTAALAAAAIAIGTALVAASSVTDASEDHPLRRILVTTAVIVLIAGAVFWQAVPRGGVTAIVLGTLALLSVAAFWLGITPVLAAGAFATGRSGGSATGSRALRVAAALAALAALAYAVVVTYDFTSS